MQLNRLLTFRAYVRFLMIYVTHGFSATDENSLLAKN